MYTKKNTRVTFRSNRRSNFKRNNNYSNGKPRNKGNITQQYNKYLKLAKEATSSGDRIQSEYYYQFTDHYYRLMVELGISFEDGENNENKLSELSADDSLNSSNLNESDVVETTNVSEVNEKGVKNSNDDKDDDIESIESVPFISKPVKKKITKSKKIPA